MGLQAEGGDRDQDEEERSKCYHLWVRKVIEKSRQDWGRGALLETRRVGTDYQTVSQWRGKIKIKSRTTVPSLEGLYPPAQVLKGNAS
jgi:hypothetical protein